MTTTVGDTATVTETGNDLTGADTISTNDATSTSIHEVGGTTGGLHA